MKHFDDMLIVWFHSFHIVYRPKNEKKNTSRERARARASEKERDRDTAKKHNKWLYNSKNGVVDVQCTCTFQFYNFVASSVVGLNLNACLFFAIFLSCVCVWQCLQLRARHRMFAFLFMRTLIKPYKRHFMPVVKHIKCFQHFFFSLSFSVSFFVCLCLSFVQSLSDCHCL